MIRAIFHKLEKNDEEKRQKFKKEPRFFILELQYLQNSLWTYPKILTMFYEVPVYILRTSLELNVTHFLQTSYKFITNA